MYRRVELVVATLACGLALGGCGSGKSPSGGGLPISPVSSDALTPTQPPLPLTEKRLHRARRLGAHVPGKLLSMPWVLVDVRRGGQVLVVYFVSGDGQRFDGVNNIGFRVIETSASVELIAVSRDKNSGPAEPDSLATGFAEIVLSERLGTRALLHAPTAKDWPAKMLLS